MKRLIQRILLLLIASGWMINTGEAQFLGAEMSYEIGPEIITVKLSVYEGLAANHGGIDDKVLITGVSSSTTAEVDLTKVSSRDVSPACAGTCSRLKNFRCKFPYTVIEHKYEGILFKNELNENDCDIKLSWSACCRPNAGTNNSFYLESSANVCLENLNSSPVISNAPVLFVPVNRPLTYALEVFDVDHDSFSMELIPSRISSTTDIKYPANLSYQSPIQYLGYPKKDAAYPRGFHIDPKLNQLKFTPSKLGGNNLAISIKEFRNGKLVGETVRDVFVEVVNPSNSFPVITGINGGLKGELELCSGSESTFKIYTDDLDAADDVDISFVHNLPNAKIEKYSGKRPYLEITWKPEAADVLRKDLYLTVKAEDNSCDLKGLTYRTFSFKVVPSVTADFEFKASACRHLNFKATSLLGKNQKASYEWQIEGRDELFTGNTLTYTFENFGSYGVQLQATDQNTGCVSKITRNVQLKAPNQVAVKPVNKTCPNQPVQLSASGSEHYSWSEIGDGSELSKASTFTFTAKENTQIKVTGFDKFGCSTTDTIDIQVHETDLNVSSSADLVCHGQQVTLTALDGKEWTWDTDNLVRAADNEAKYLVTGDLSVEVNAIADNGCAIQKTIQVRQDVDCVWPGEVNGDGVVNNHDILPIGLAYGEIYNGVKNPVDMKWKPYSTPNWYRAFDNGRNIKHADANNDGSIDYMDITPIDAFYEVVALNPASEKRKTYTGSKLYLEYDTLKRNGKTTYIISVNLGTESKPAKDAYGIAFSIKYNSFVPSSSVSFDTKNSWLKSGHTTSNTIQLVKNIPADKSGGRIDVGYSRTNKIPVTGWGQIGVLKFIVDDNIDLKRPGSFVLSMHNYSLIDHLGIELDVYDESLEIPFELNTGIYSNATINAEIFPNPASSVINVQLPEGNYSRISLINALGQEVRSINRPSAGLFHLNTEGLSGAYFIRIVGEKGQSTFPVQIRQ